MLQTKLEHVADDAYAPKVETTSPDRVLSAGSDPYMGGVLEVSPVKALDLDRQCAVAADKKDHGVESWTALAVDQIHQ